jgi:hypothetical protein
MRKLILITAIMLASATAQAGDQRSLSTGLTTSLPTDKPATAKPATAADPKADNSLRAYNDTPATGTPQPSERPRYISPATTAQTDTPAPAPAPAATPPETPRYNPRPAAVESTPPATPSTTQREPTTTEPTYRRSRGGYGRVEHARIDRSRPQYQQMARHHHRPRLSARRIIAALHRYGIYW